MTGEWWQTDRAFLFLLSQEDGVEPTWLRCMGLQALTWSKPPTKVCEHCGSAVPIREPLPKGVCDRCGKTISIEAYAAGAATAILAAAMPQGDKLLHLPNGATIDVVYRECGRIDDYDEQGVVLRLSGCHISKWWFSPVSALFSDDTQILKLCARVECNLTIRVPNLYCVKE